MSNDQQELRDFIGKLYDIQGQFHKLSPPNYLGEQERREWEAIFSRYEYELSQTIDKADIELSRESWYDR
jgi:hypothetical protein